jgi:hypothetical protein
VPPVHGPHQLTGPLTEKLKLSFRARATFPEIDRMKAHYLPTCYLKGFIDPASEVEAEQTGEPYVWVRNPSTGIWKNRAPHNVAKRPDYYAVTMTDGTKNQAREEALKQLENAVAPILRRIPTSDTLMPEDPAVLISFANTMYLRLPVVHDAAEQTMILPKLRETLSKSWARLRGDPEELRRSLEACARDTGDPDVLLLKAEDLEPERYELTANREFVIDRLFQVGRKLLQILSQMRWRLLRPVEPHRLITSDRPVFIVDPKAPDAERHFLLSPGAMFSLPLTKEVLLLGDWGGPPGLSWANITTAGVRDMNLRCTGPGMALYSSTRVFLGLEELTAIEAAHAAS